METIEKRRRGRPKGSGHPISPEFKKPNPLKGMYKIYALQDPTTMDYFYVGLTRQWLCKRLEYHIYCATKLHQQSARDKWILRILNEGLKPKIVMIEKLQTKDEVEAKKIENSYISKYGLTNTATNTFKGKYIPKGRIYPKEEILKLFNEGYKASDISQKLSIKPSIVSYWLKKEKLNKKEKVSKDIIDINNLTKQGYNSQSIKSILNLSEGELTYRLQKINKAS